MALTTKKKKPARAPEKKAPEKRPERPAARGFMGRGRGESTYIQQADEWRGTTVQVCGLWPFAVGTGTPMVGVPLGRHIVTGATVCCDPISWFQRAKLISNPSVFVLGKPGLGKSTLIRRMATGLAGYGVMPLVLGDLKPDYVDLIEAMGGQVITLGRGRGYLNILDPGEAVEAAQQLADSGHEKEAKQVLADAHGRRANMVSALLTISRQAPPNDREETIIDRGLKYLDDHFEGVPVLADLLQVIREAPEELRSVALDRGSMERYKEITEGLEASLIGLTGGGRLGETFSKHTTNPMRRDRPVVYDVSAIDDNEQDLQAAVLLACWSAGFGTVNVANALADAGLEPRRHYFVVLDELWRALRAGRGMVDRVDALTRLNRQRGVGMAMISHTMSDLLSLASEDDRMKARGFVERSGMVVCGGLPSAEMPQLTDAVPFSQAEQELMIGWQDPPAWDPSTGREAEPPGRGKFLVKVGGRPGIPLKVELTPVELGVSDTNKLWHEQSRADGRRARRQSAE
ncbi:ATP/GTP-binding protein [Leucobacter sp. UCMA 4100]|uniref:ATP/GTP-binding protein n=1 Tax=Leucobacter sp. UCMA 4100 TaxID=2810534 RepID=UPI0022EB6EB4|nr:ATP/GTP-binding protein [Leucobacter sp. UCMA 4100]MDA3145770.1 ATP/GTP-binding protein [Leucobacter sp. UCMA 4100]